MTATLEDSVTVVRGGTVVDAVDGMRRADVAIHNSRIVDVGSDLVGDDIVDAGGMLVMPGAIDVHSHADARILDDDTQLALLRQGVTSIIVGQDGVSFVPGDGGYANDYFGALNGRASEVGSTVADILARYDHTTRLNVGYLVPAGTVRFEVMGNSAEAPTREQLRRMVELVSDGLDDGALGLSTGLDYVPGCFADTDELVELCRPVALAGAVYVTHMRGYEEEAVDAFAEVEEIAGRSGVAAHISHLHARYDLLGELISGAGRHGFDVTFDAYPYSRGNSLLSMVVLPKPIVALGNAEAGRILGTSEGRRRLAGEIRAAQPGAFDDIWADRLQIASAGSGRWAWMEGRTLGAAAALERIDVLELALTLLADSELRTTVVMDVPEPRTDSELALQFALPGALCGSDGIFVGAHPHPRARGCFARMLGTFVRERHDFDWPAMSRVLSLAAVERFGLGARGRVTQGAVADLALVDEGEVGDAATYENPLRLARGIDTVLVAGRPVLRDGQLTADLSGRSLRADRSATGSTATARSRKGKRNTMKTPLVTANAPQPAGPYSQAIIANGFLFTAGFGPTDPATGVNPQGVGDQTRQVLRNIGSVLAEAGLDFSDVVKVTAHLQNLKADFSEFNAAFAEFVPEPYPVRTTVGSDLANILVEIDVVAALR